MKKKRKKIDFKTKTVIIRIRAKRRAKFSKSTGKSEHP